MACKDVGEHAAEVVLELGWGAGVIDVPKVDDNVRLRMQKASITRNLTKEEALAAAAAQAAAQKKA